MSATHGSHVINDIGPRPGGAISMEDLISRWESQAAGTAPERSQEPVSQSRWSSSDRTPPPYPDSPPIVTQPSARAQYLYLESPIDPHYPRSSAQSSRAYGTDDNESGHPPSHAYTPDPNYTADPPYPTSDVSHSQGDYSMSANATPYWDDGPDPFALSVAYREGSDQYDESFPYGLSAGRSVSRPGKRTNANTPHYDGDPANVNDPSLYTSGYGSAPPSAFIGGQARSAPELGHTANEEYNARFQYSPTPSTPYSPYGSGTPYSYSNHPETGPQFTAAYTQSPSQSPSQIPGQSPSPYLSSGLPPVSPLSSSESGRRPVSEMSDDEYYEYQNGQHTPMPSSPAYTRTPSRNPSNSATPVSPLSFSDLDQRSSSTMSDDEFYDRYYRQDNPIPSDDSVNTGPTFDDILSRLPSPSSHASSSRSRNRFSNFVSRLTGRSGVSSGSIESGPEPKTRAERNRSRLSTARSFFRRW